MTKASNNIFPSVLFDEATEPSSPSAGTQRLFVDDADKLLKIKDSAGTVTTIGTGSGSGIATTGVMFVIDGGGSAITTGVKIPWYSNLDGTITAVTVLLDQSGSIVVDLWLDTYANYLPTNADSITASATPTVSSATKSRDSTLTGWTKTIAVGDVILPNVDSITTATWAVIILDIDLT